MGFQRDLSRIIFSNSYRRLAGKTQIFPVEENDHYMTRLTHTLVVNNIALDIANKINDDLHSDINVDLIQAIANGHDIGHTPFDHAGEREINIICKKEKFFHDKYFFKHNIFGIDVLQNLERIKNFEYGYDLSWQVIDGIIKHTDLVKEQSSKNVLKYQVNNIFLNSENLRNTINKLKYCKQNANKINYFEYPFPITIEGQIVKIADEIAQYYHDILDFSRYYFQDDANNPVYSLLNNDLCKIKNLRINPQYIKKFVNTYRNEEKIMDNKIFKPENRETFANDFKELFITEVVDILKNKLTNSGNVLNVESNSNRFIVENLLFSVAKDEKVKPEFKHDYVIKASEIFIEYRKERLKSDCIKKLDNDGCKKINTTLNKIINNKKIFFRLCGNDFLREMKK